MATTLEDLQERLRASIIDHVLTLPSSLDLLKEATQAVERVNEVSLDELEMTNEETGDSNARAVRSVDRTLDDAKNAVRELAANTVSSLLTTPFEQAVVAARDAGITLDEWYPKDWLKAIAENAPDRYPYVIRAVVYGGNPDEAEAWFRLINEESPSPKQMGTVWVEQLASAGASSSTTKALVAAFAEAYLNDDEQPEPTRLRAPDDTASSVRSIKLKALHKEAFNAFYNQNSSALQGHMWATHGMDLGRLDWAQVVDRMVWDIVRENNGNRTMLQPVKESAYGRITLWMTRLTSTGHLDDWLDRPEQWTPVALPNAGAATRYPVEQVVGWMKEHANNGTFSWSVLVAGMEGLNQPGLAQEFKRLGERWSLAHEAAQVVPDNAPSARERARL